METLVIKHPLDQTQIDISIQEICGVPMLNQSADDNFHGTVKLSCLQKWMEVKSSHYLGLCKQLH